MRNYIHRVDEQKPSIGKGVKNGLIGRRNLQNRNKKTWIRLVVESKRRDVTIGNYPRLVCSLNCNFGRHAMDTEKKMYLYTCLFNCHALVLVIPSVFFTAALHFLFRIEANWGEKSFIEVVGVGSTSSCIEYLKENMIYFWELSRLV